MGFFTKKHKQIALNNFDARLFNKYKRSEQKLIECAKTGSEKELKKAMKIHRNYEYASLFKETPEYQKLVNKKQKR